MNLPNVCLISRLTEHYALKGNPLSCDLGVWSSASGLLRPTHADMWERRSDLRGLKLKASFISYKPFAFKDGRGRPAGLVPDILGVIKARTNYREDVAIAMLLTLNYHNSFIAKFSFFVTTTSLRNLLCTTNLLLCAMRQLML